VERLVFLFPRVRPPWSLSPLIETGLDNWREEIEAHRRQYTDADRVKHRVFERFDAGRVQSLPLVEAVAADVALEKVDRILNRLPDIVSVEPVLAEFSKRINRSTGAPGSTVGDARRIINSDGLRAFNSGAIALLDTGVWPKHELFQPDRLAVNLEGAVTPGGTVIWTPYEGVSAHGTRSASILSGGAALGADLRGVSDIPVHSYRVYQASYTSEGTFTGDRASAELTIHALDLASASQIGTILVESQEMDGDMKAVSKAADAAFALGAAVVATVGNTPGPNQAAAPAEAHTVLAAGAIRISDGQQAAEQSEGPTIPDGRTKPDVQGLTGTITGTRGPDLSGGSATPVYDTSATSIHSGTSGAAPYVAASAAMIRSSLEATFGANVPPGAVYALLLAAGENVPPTPQRGAGLIRLPTPGTFLVGEETVHQGYWYPIELTLPAGTAHLDIALWWPEATGDVHNDIDAYIDDVNGYTVASSLEVESVFERLRATPASLTTDTDWTLWIHGFDVTTPQPLYWAAIAVEPAKVT